MCVESGEGADGDAALLVREISRDPPNLFIFASFSDTYYTFTIVVKM